MTTTFLDRWRLPLAARSDERELLDAVVLDAHHLAVNLRELAMLNRLPGGVGASLAAISALADGRRDLSVLDAGTGGGDMALAMARHGRTRAGAGAWRVTALDSSADVLALAAARVGGDAEVHLERGTVLALPFDDAAFDVAHASLLLHHLDPADAVIALIELRRVARLGVVINDLRRGWLPYAMTALAVRGLCRGRYTRHDGLASVRRAYTLRELDDLLAAAGLRVAARSAAFLPRIVTVAVAAA
jgi:SAM-dependent methyltransferase